MIGAIRTAVRPTATKLVGRRTYSAGADAVGEAFVKEREAVQHHAAKSAAFWRKVTLYVALPAIAVGYFNSENLLKEHQAHMEHLKEENGGELPDRVRFEYLCVVKKSWPFGDGRKSLFYNPQVNMEPPE